MNTVSRLLVCVVLPLLMGCFESTPPPSAPAAERVETILNDTADDLELGAKIRTVVEKQQRRRELKHPKTVAELTGRHYYPLNSILFGMTFIIWVSILIDILRRSDERKD